VGGGLCVSVSHARTHERPCQMPILRSYPILCMHLYHTPVIAVEVTACAGEGVVTGVANIWSHHPVPMMSGPCRVGVKSMAPKHAAFAEAPRWSKGVGCVSRAGAVRTWVCQTHTVC